MKIIILVTVLHILMVSAELDLLNLQPRNVHIKPRFNNSTEKSNKTGPVISNYIIGGSIAHRTQFPWQVALKTDGYLFCGGSLISGQWILTAAHCAEGINEFDVYVGGFNIGRVEARRIQQKSKTKFIHPNYNNVTVKNDVALIKLPKYVKQSQYIRFIRLPKISDSNKTFEGLNTTVSGWGLNQNGKKSAELKYVNVHVITNEKCSETFDIIESSTMCTSGTGVKGTCNGDSGGPLVYKETDGKFTQIGIVSFGTESCTDSYPSAFAKISSFLDWISNVTHVAIRA